MFAALRYKSFLELLPVTRLHSLYPCGPSAVFILQSCSVLPCHLPFTFFCTVYSWTIQLSCLWLPSSQRLPCLFCCITCHFSISQWYSCWRSLPLKSPCSFFFSLLSSSRTAQSRQSATSEAFLLDFVTSPDSILEPEQPSCGAIGEVFWVYHNSSYMQPKVYVYSNQSLASLISVTTAFLLGQQVKCSPCVPDGNGYRVIWNPSRTVLTQTWQLQQTWLAMFSEAGASICNCKFLVFCFS